MAATQPAVGTEELFQRLGDALIAEIKGNTHAWMSAIKQAGATPAQVAYVTALLLPDTLKAVFKRISALEQRPLSGVQ